MKKVIRSVNRIPLIDINQMEEDGINAFERLKMEMALKMIRDLPIRLFNKLFEVRIIDPRKEETFNKLFSNFGDVPSSYNKALLEMFYELKTQELAEIEMNLTIEDND
jgi:hypothetical protein